MNSAVTLAANNSGKSVEEEEQRAQRKGEELNRTGTRQDSTRQDRTRQDKTGQDKTGQDRTRQDKTG